MKTRNGFVSNSSSSSFIVDLNKWPSIDNLYIANEMILIRDEEFYGNRAKKLSKMIKNLRKSLDPYSNIKFATCNYDTYIVRETDFVYIFTCNNYSFESLSFFTKIDDEEDEFYTKQERLKMDFFYHLDFGEYIKTKYNAYEYNGLCKEHDYSDVLEFKDGTKYCEYCYKDRITFLTSKLKKRMAKGLLTEKNQYLFLNKDFCKKCVLGKFNNRLQWGEKDEKCWERGYHLCALEDYPTTIDRAPKNCPYLLEHEITKNDCT
jgi:hypothetical protein